MPLSRLSQTPTMAAAAAPPPPPGYQHHQQCKVIATVVTRVVHAYAHLRDQFVGIVPVGSMVYCPEQCNDFDIVILLQNRGPQHECFLQALANAMGTVYGEEDVVYVAAARVPILKFHMRPSGCHFDLSVLLLADDCVVPPPARSPAIFTATDEFLTGCCAPSDVYVSILFARWVMCLLHSVPILRHVISFMKRWAQTRCIYGTTRGYPGGSAWVVMVTQVVLKFQVLLSLETLLQNVARFLYRFPWRRWDSNGEQNDTYAMVVRFPAAMFDGAGDRVRDGQGWQKFNMSNTVGENQLRAIECELALLNARLQVFIQQGRVLHRLCNNCVQVAHVGMLDDLCREGIAQEVASTPHALFLLVFLLVPATYAEETFVSAKLIPRILRILDDNGCPSRPLGLANGQCWKTETAAEYRSLPVAIMLCSEEGFVTLTLANEVAAQCCQVLHSMWQKRPNFVRLRLTRNITAMVY